jgi:hypothetical protein
VKISSMVNVEGDIVQTQKHIKATMQEIEVKCGLHYNVDSS